MHKDTKKSILFVIGNLTPGGKERQLVELIYHLPKEQFNAHLLVKNYDVQFLEKIKNKLTSFHSLNKRHFQLFELHTFVCQINQIKPDIVCSWAQTTSHFCLFAYLFAIKKFKLMNCSIRNAPLKLSLRLKLERLLYDFYRVVVANSKAGLVAYNQNGKKRRYVLYNGFDTARIPKISKVAARDQLNISKERFVVVMVASLTEKKDHETFLYSIRECTKYQQKIDFFIVGDGPNRTRLEKQAKQMKINSNLFFLGKRDDVELIFRTADVSVLTSTADFGEGISNSIIESLGCGTPVIATDNPGTREIIDDGKNGFIIKPGDYKALTERIAFLKNNPKMRKRLSHNGLEKIKSKFSLDQMVTQFEDIMAS